MKGIDAFSSASKTSNSRGYTIRAYHPRDLHSVISLFRRAVVEIACSDYNSRQINAWTAIEPKIWHQRLVESQVWLAEKNSTLAGFITCYEGCVIDLLFVHPLFQRQSVASFLLETLTAHSLKHSVPELCANVSLTARPFFEKNGFRVIREQQVNVRGENFKNFRMSKLLSEP